MVVFHMGYIDDFIMESNFPHRKEKFTNILVQNVPRNSKRNILHALMAIGIGTIFERSMLYLHRKHIQFDTYEICL